MFWAPIATDVFPADYDQARRRWLALARQCPALTWHRPYVAEGAGPQGEALVTDALWLGDAQADRVLVVIAGTHGIEGFAGSAVEIDHLQAIVSGQWFVPNGMAILLIHALTPWGYAWLRRCDQGGIDLNRNFVDFSSALPENPGYDELRSALFIADDGQRQAVFVDFERKHGRVALETAISGGQFRDPWGPFFGGLKATHGRQVIDDLIAGNRLSEKDLVVVDLHTGLGPYGYGEIICDHPPESEGTASALRYFGDSVTLPWLGTSSSVPKLGLLDYAWHAVMNDRSCYVTLEFGTYGTDPLFDVLLTDHRLWAESGNEAQRQAHGLKMRRHFCPDDPAWRELVLFRARQVIAQAIKGLGCA